MRNFNVCSINKQTQELMKRSAESSQPPHSASAARSFFLSLKLKRRHRSLHSCVFRKKPSSPLGHGRFCRIDAGLGSFGSGLHVLGDDEWPDPSE
mmetsp:Transcript_29402/g.80785  ORF Transcript_29402/g.80785 Transcript_29402/m.80785 type:complete len:95 (+) Transcript_29402:90-374(+)